MDVERTFHRDSEIACRPVAIARRRAAPLKIVGFDDMSCRAWIQSKDDAEVRNSHLAWIRGVLTGHNYANQSQQVSAMSPGTVQNFVDRYCVETRRASSATPPSGWPTSSPDVINRSRNKASFVTFRTDAVIGERYVWHRTGAKHARHH